jgi:hypothetical protein
MAADADPRLSGTGHSCDVVRPGGARPRTCGPPSLPATRGWTSSVTNVTGRDCLGQPTRRLAKNGKTSPTAPGRARSPLSLSERAAALGAEPACILKTRSERCRWRDVRRSSALIVHLRADLSQWVGTRARGQSLSRPRQVEVDCSGILGGLVLSLKRPLGAGGHYYDG